MEAAHDVPTWRTYWGAWLVLLAVTVAMVLVSSRPVLIAGMAVKAAIIGLWFMHLRYERAGLVLIVVLATLLTTLVLFGLLVPDARAM